LLGECQSQITVARNKPLQGRPAPQAESAYDEREGVGGEHSTYGGHESEHYIGH